MTASELNDKSFTIEQMYKAFELGGYIENEDFKDNFQEYLQSLKQKERKVEIEIDLKKELLEFLEANNNFGIEEPEKVVDLYIEVYKEGKSENYFTNLESDSYILLCGEFIQDPTTTSSKCMCGRYKWEHPIKK